MSKRHSAIQKMCLYCEHASFMCREGDAPSYKDVIGGEEDREILCRYRGAVKAEGKCLRFSFDPIKYTPKKSLPLPTLSEADVIT